MYRANPRRLTVLALLAFIPFVAAEEPLPQDVRIRSGKLPNGVTWQYREHNNPPGKMALLVHVETGSLNETDAQRGLAHFIEHMAFNGTEHYPPGTLIPYFESIGMEFGPDVNAFTSFDQTAYMLFLPDPNVEQVDRALKVLSDYVFRMTLLPEEIEKERGVILSELRAGMNAQQRVRDALFERLFGEFRFGQRIPIGKEEVLRSATRREFEDYYRSWYHPERITLILVGDSAPEPYLPAIEKWFGEYRAPAANKTDLGAGFKPFDRERAIVLTDPEYAQGDVDIYRLNAGRPPTTTVERARVELIDELASWIMDRRFSERIKKGEAAFRTASAAAIDFFNEAVLANGSATGEPADWEKMLSEMIIEVNRAREHGFLPAELELARKELLAEAEDAVRKEPTQDARTLLFEIMQAVNDEEPVLSAQHELELLQKLLPTIKVEEVSAAFAAQFEPGAYAYVVTLPKRDDVRVPTEEEVLAAGRAALARKTDPPAEVKAAADLLEREPTPGTVLETTKDAELEITSVWLSNGARAHHRFMDYKKDLVLVTITLAGGQIEETAENAGITQAAGLILQQPATSRLSSTEIQDLMTGKNISVRGGGQDDAFTLVVSGSPRDLEAGLQLAYALLTDARLEQSAFDNWKQKMVQQYAMASKMPPAVAFDTWVRAITGDDPRKPVLVPPAWIERQSAAAAQAWFQRLARTAPIEVSVVGELALDEALSLIAKYVGALPERPRAATHLAALRKFNRPPGPLERKAGVETITPQAGVVYGFMGTDISDMAAKRALDLAANILGSRLIKQVREDAGLVYSIDANNVPGMAYEDFGFFVTGAPCAPEKANEVLDLIQKIFTEFATAGPTAEELDNAKKQIINSLDTQLREPSYWSGQLRQLELHRIQLADLKNVPDKFQAYTAAEVQAAFARFFVPTRTFRIAAIPTGEPE